MITVDFTGNLGNHMWQYATCRTIAEDLGYKWGFNKNFQGDYFISLDYGEEVKEIQNSYTTIKRIIKKADNPEIWGYDENLVKVQDNTQLYGVYQTDRYIKHKNVSQWFKYKPEFIEKTERLLLDNNIILDDNTCVMNMRGGFEYRNLPQVLLQRVYWHLAMEYMEEKFNIKKFFFVSDDIELCKSYFPSIPAYHFDIGTDFYIVNNAKYSILANSSFSWWAAYLNEKSKFILAPKYWARHNVSDGFWAEMHNQVDRFHYMDREGNVFNGKFCIEEAEEYYLKNSSYIIS